ncbi:MAG: hypothetical protein DRI57_10395 [Deltaproteobacteria bacterium]|nr:MAG: hypothetical protein DRI57_10395 [Deltaproteobacteria bacterium]
MDTVAEIEEIKTVLSKMSREKLSIFRRWFIEEFDADAWDSQFEDDVLSGRLDALAEEAIRDFEEGRCTEMNMNTLSPKFI